MPDPWLYIEDYWAESVQGRPVWAQVRWAFHWTSLWAAQGPVTGSTAAAFNQRMSLEGDLDEVEHGGPYGRWGFEPMFVFKPMHLRIEYSALERVTKATVVNRQDNETQELDAPFLNPYIYQSWFPEQGNLGIVAIALFDGWDTVATSAKTAIRAAFTSPLFPPR
jgi:hypothetical protein